MDTLRHTVETHFASVLLVACLLGMVMPGIGHLPSEVAVLVPALLMFTACFKLKEGGFELIDWRMVGRFQLLRYVVLPVVLWAICLFLVPKYAVGVFLMATLPAGISTPALAGLYNGRIAPGFAIVVISQLMTPILIPLQFYWLGQVDSSIQGAVIPSPYVLLRTIVICILLPMGIYYFVRKKEKLATTMKRESKLISVLLVSFLIMMVVAKQRDLFLAEGFMLAAAVVLSICCYLIFMFAGWFLSHGQPRDVRVTVSVCSMFINAALGVSLALLHFTGATMLYITVCEMTWALLPMLFNPFIKRV